MIIISVCLQLCKSFIELLKTIFKKLLHLSRHCRPLRACTQWTFWRQETSQQYRVCVCVCVCVDNRGASTVLDSGHRYRHT
jgi:hypothetical protein